MALDNTKRRGDKLAAAEWNEIVNEINHKQSKLMISGENVSGIDTAPNKLHPKHLITSSGVAEALEAKYPTYQDLETATEAIDENSKAGDTVKILQPDGSVKEYWLQPNSEEQLVYKEKGGEFNLDRDSKMEIVEDGTIITSLGYKVLADGVDFSSQIIKANFVYEIRDKFDLDGQTVTVPTNSTLMFNGGQIVNGTLVCDNTTFSGNVNIKVLLQGTIVNDYIYSSWFTSDSYSLNSDIVNSICNLQSEQTLVFNKDITLNAGTLTVSKIKFQGENNAVINNPPIFRSTGNIFVKDLNFRNIEVISQLFNSYANIHSVVTFESVTVDGCSTLRSVYHAEYKNEEAYNNKYVNLTINNCEFYNVKGIVISCEAPDKAIITDNYIHDIGTTEIKPVIGVLLGVEPNYVSYDSLISNNKIENILCAVSTGHDSREVHGILIYGFKNKVINNYISNIHSLDENQEQVPPGADSEGLYLKGGDNLIEGNYISYAGSGSTVDGTICLKGGQENNIIRNNIIYLSGGTAITSYNNKTNISNNYIYAKDRLSFGIYLVKAGSTGSPSGSVIENNTISCIYDTVTYAFGTAFGIQSSFNNLIRGNITYNCAKCTYFLGNDSYNNVIRDNKFYWKDLEFSNLDANTQWGIINTANYPEQINIFGNVFLFKGVKFGLKTYLAYSNVWFHDNEIYIGVGDNPDSVKGLNTQSTYGLFRGSASIIEDNHIIIEPEATAKFNWFYSQSTAVFRNNIFNATTIKNIVTSNAYNNKLITVPTVGSSENIPENTSESTKVTAGFQYFDTTEKRLLIFDGTKFYYGDNKTYPIEPGLPSLSIKEKGTFIFAGNTKKLRYWDGVCYRNITNGGIAIDNSGTLLNRCALAPTNGFQFQQELVLPELDTNAAPSTLPDYKWMNTPYVKIYGIITANGITNPSGTQYYAVFNVENTDYVLFKHTKRKTGSSYISQTQGSGYCFTDENDQLISFTDPTNSSAVMRYSKIAVPSNAKYFKLTLYVKSGDTTYYIKSIDDYRIYREKAELIYKNNIWYKIPELFDDTYLDESANNAIQIDDSTTLAEAHNKYVANARVTAELYDETDPDDYTEDLLLYKGVQVEATDFDNSIITWNGSVWKDILTDTVLQTATPTITFSVDNETTLAILTSMTGSSIYYTLDGSTPTTESNVYSEPIELSEGNQVQAIAVYTGMSQSSVGFVKVSTPEIVNDNNEITITTQTSGATIYYTTDGSTPTSSSSQYSGAIQNLETGTTIKAIAYMIGRVNSEIAEYTIEENQVVNE